MLLNWRLPSSVFALLVLGQIVVGPGSGNSGGSSTIVGGTCTNQTVTAIATDGTPTCTTITSAYVNSSVITNGGALGTPSSGVATNLTGTASGLTAGNVAVGGITGLGSGVATWLATPASSSISSGGMLYAAVLETNLGSPANGTVVYCSDCTLANPCAGSGTGAIAKRLNGVWVCN